MTVRLCPAARPGHRRSPPGAAREYRLQHDQAAEYQHEQADQTQPGVRAGDERLPDRGNG
ncbi:hypothetical protein [Nocardia blacklockiae]|uniref:hypothetical protein n=1 Tax=Nocardia blacklockiae TaxID=480036 RepID=UPI00189421BF|nr:hypothetical protein [Nocardia blacklockiae]MBF6171029.1 hypothetical protein [Nocardia blacklockiae]